MKKLWSGRFTQEAAASLEAFTESVSFDKRLWSHDIKGSIAHAQMLEKQGLISPSDNKAIREGLLSIAQDIEAGTFVFRQDLEDIHMNIEAELIKRTGDAGRKLHTARSRNDQVALDVRLYLKEETGRIIDLIRAFQGALITQARAHVDTAMPGYTHMQRAQPVTLAHHLLAYVEMLERDAGRYQDSLKRIDQLPLGSCALAGTTLPVDRQYVADLLGFAEVSRNSMDSVSDRDFAIEFIAHSSILAMHLSRMAEELVLWSGEEFGFVELADAYTTGSSIMPQKKNPDMAELVRGKTGRVYGSLVAILTMMKGLPLAYNRDMQEDKEPLFDTADTVKQCLQVMTEMTGALTFRVDRMRRTAASGFSLATDLAEYLVEKGVPFRQAHEITGNVVRYCIDRQKTLEELSLGELKEFSPAMDSDVHERLTIDSALLRRKSQGGTSPDEIRRQLQRLQTDQH